MAEVFHRLRLLDSRHGNEWLTVDLWAYVRYSPGGVVLDENSHVFMHTLDGDSGLIPPEDLPDVAAALQLAAELMGYRA